jgi:hypothetical protein
MFGSRSEGPWMYRIPPSTICHLDWDDEEVPILLNKSKCINIHINIHKVKMSPISLTPVPEVINCHEFQLKFVSLLSMIIYDPSFLPTPTHRRTFAWKQKQIILIQSK